MRCGCAWLLLRESGDGASRLRRPARCWRRTACVGSTFAGSMLTALRACIAEQARAAESRLAPAAGVMVQAVWFDAGAERGRAAAADHPSSCGGRGVVAHPGAGSCGGLGGDCARAGAGACAARDLVPALGAAACGSTRRIRRVVGELAFWTGMLSEPALSLVDGSLDPDRDIAGTARPSHADAAGGGDGGAADPGSGGVPWRHQRCAADRPGVGGCGLVPAAWSGRRHMRCCSISRGTAARRSSPTSTCRARSAGSPACSRCGLIPARSISTRRWRGARRSGARSS